MPLWLGLFFPIDQIAQLGYWAEMPIIHSPFVTAILLNLAMLTAPLVWHWQTTSFLWLSVCVVPIMLLIGRITNKGLIGLMLLNVVYLTGFALAVHHGLYRL